MTIAAYHPAPVARTNSLAWTLKAEFAKTFTLRSAWLSMAFAILAAGGLAALNASDSASNWHTMSATDRAAFDPTRNVLFNILVCAFIFGSLGTRAVTTEYSTGMIRVSIAAMHDRTRLLFAKAFVVATLALIVSLISNVLAVLVGQRIFQREGIQLSLQDTDVVRAIVLSAMAISALAIVGLAFGTLLRRAAASDVAFGVFLIGAQLLFAVLPDGAQKYVPINLLFATTALKPTDDVLAPGLAIGILALSAAALLAIAAQVINRRDA